MKVDISTLNADRGRFARICVELDQTQAVVGTVCLEGHWYKVEYEGLQVICTKCGCYGHRSRECTGQTPVVAAVVAAKQTTPNPNEVVKQTTPRPKEVEAPTSTETATIEQGELNPTVVVDGSCPSVDLLVESSASMGNNEKIEETRAVIPVNQLRENFEILGDWMVVSKRKKKPGVNQGPKKVHGNKGANNGFIPDNNELRKSKGFDISKTIKTGPHKFAMGKATHFDANPKKNIKRRLRPGEGERFFGLSIGASSSRGPSSTSMLPYADGDLNAMVFGENNQADDAAGEYLQRIWSSRAP